MFSWKIPEEYIADKPGQGRNEWFWGCSELQLSYEQDTGNWNWGGVENLGLS